MRYHLVVSLSVKNAIVFNKQSGFLLPLALLVVVTLSTLVVILFKQVNASAEAGINVSLYQQSYHAADMVGQLASHQLLYPRVDRQQTDARCLSLSSVETVNLPGLSQCRLSATCVCRYESSDFCDPTQHHLYDENSTVNHSFYYIEAVAECGSGIISAQERLRFTLSYLGE